MNDRMTPDEERAIELTTELANVLSRVVSDGAARTQDTLELHAHIHAIQHAVMSNHLARSRPDIFRVLGGDAPVGSLDG